MNVKDLIPQRAPFLFVDKIIEREGNKIVTSYQVTGDEDFFKGHFPGNPIMPGVLLQEALFQSGACLMATGSDGGLGVVAKVSNAKFKNMVRPGDELVMEVELTEQISNAFYFKGKTKVAGKMVLSIEFTCAKV
ncbi:FabA-like domain protein [Bacteriovorax sp. BAL6_X]|uniref:3-hydroxyacyl-ACP dehydratase FabZ n=1 Tax=Bacteriovorax sp. BAL6_X TaxID=1201290 RepID=UPI0003862631|nr:3-hydroxyacyl-ACP dehydratase FabZ [Bacteriovorax sp. BAL6_X]EPZ51016.1 FabA-like domain protein [Bacteriovorax sp. BAL6_X]